MKGSNLFSYILSRKAERGNAPAEEINPRPHMGDSARDYKDTVKGHPSDS